MRARTKGMWLGHSATSSKPGTQLATRSDSIAFILVVAIIIACALLGGSSRTDVGALLILRPLLIVLCIVLVLLPEKRARNLTWAGVKVPLVFLGIFAAIAALQLVPLPPAWWRALPGHALFAEAAGAAGMAQPWRPISLSPGATWNFLVAMIVPFAVLLGCARLGIERREKLLPVVIALGVLSAVIGIVQMTVPLRFYPISHLGFPTGLFANKNHQAALLACMFPILRVWAYAPERGTGPWTVRLAVAIGIALFLVPMILATGSRAGLVLGAIGIVAALFIVPLQVSRNELRPPVRRALGFALVAAPLLLVAVTVIAGRNVAVDRLIALSDLSQENRVLTFSVLVDIARHFFPFGSGLGTFEPVYQVFEPDSLLLPNYLNHAHNDLLELAITGGLAALVVTAGFLVWVVLVGKEALVPGPKDRADRLYRRLGVVVVVLLLLASILDYPLRTPFLGALFVLACVWMGQAPAPRRRADPV